MIGITALFTALLRRQRAFQLTKSVDYHPSPKSRPVQFVHSWEITGNLWLASHILRASISWSLTPFPSVPRCPSCFPQEVGDWLERMFLRSIVNFRTCDLRGSAGRALHLWVTPGSVCVCVSCTFCALVVGEDAGFYDAWRWLCSSVLVLAEDSWSAAASGLHLLCSIAPADFLGPERNRDDSGEPHCQVHFNLSLHNRGWKKKSKCLTERERKKKSTKQDVWLKLDSCLSPGWQARKIG